VGTNEWLSDIVFFRGKLYAIGISNGRQDLVAIEIMDENNNDEPRVSQIERIFIGVPITSECSYLFESRGRLLMRDSALHCPGGNSFVLVAGSSKLEVFEADFGSMWWTEVRTLGDDLDCSWGESARELSLCLHMICHVIPFSSWMITLARVGRKQLILVVCMTRKTVMSIQPCLWYHG
jgi:hypothetical protein